MPPQGSPWSPETEACAETSDVHDCQPPAPPPKRRALGDVRARGGRVRHPRAPPAGEKNLSVFSGKYNAHVLLPLCLEEVKGFLAHQEEDTQWPRESDICKVHTLVLPLPCMPSPRG